MLFLLALLFPSPSLSLPRRLLSENTGVFKANDLDILDVTLIHINDFHAHFEQTSVYTSRCRTAQDHEEECYGGVARVHQRQMEIREEDPEALFLNAGDFYQGTAWYTKLKYGPMVEFGNLLNYTAMGVGNHDFDDSLEGFVPFAEQVKFPLLGANIKSHDQSFQLGIHFNKSMVTSVRGRKIGIVGYVTRSTDYNFPSHQVVFTDEVEAVREEARALKESGVDIIIALGHSGYDIDRKLAREVPELDLVVGGHSHTFLYTPTATDPVPSIEPPRGDYPTYITQTGGKLVPVVQAYCYTKYLGHLKLRFDSSGDLLTPVETKGVVYARPEILSGKKVTQSSIALAAMEKWQANLTEFQDSIGYNKIQLKELGPSKENNLGDVVCDAYAAVYPDTRIAFTNNGGLRGTLDIGEILYDDLVYILPFENRVDLVTMSGQGIKNVLEKACSRIDPDDIYDYSKGFGYQVAGLNFEVKVNHENSGDRIKNLRVKGKDGEYSHIEDDVIYNVALPNFLAGYRDERARSRQARQVKAKGIFDDDILSHVTGTKPIYEALRDWILLNSPIEQQVEGRWYVDRI